MKKSIYQVQLFGLNLYELFVLVGGTIALTFSFFLQSGDKNVLSLICSLFGTVGILFIAKGVILGQYLTLIYAVFYIILSFFSGYYGECILILITTLPGCICAIVTWRKHLTGAQGKVQIGKLRKWEYFALAGGIAVITFLAYFVLRALNTNQLEISTISFITSLGAAYMLIRRSPYYAVFYLLNDIILIVLWSCAYVAGETVLPSIICFVIFLFNDSYGLYNWLHRSKTEG